MAGINLGEYVDKLKNSSLASCYANIVIDKLIKADEITKFQILNTVLLAIFVHKIGIDDNFNVLNTKELLTRVASSLGKQISVKLAEKEIESLKDLPETGYAIVRFDFNNCFQYALYKDRVFLYCFEDSDCFRYGKMTSARIVEIERIV